MYNIIHANMHNNENEQAITAFNKIDDYHKHNFSKGNLTQMSLNCKNLKNKNKLYVQFCICN